LVGWMSESWTQNWASFGWRPLRHLRGSRGLKASMIECRRAMPLFIYTLAFALNWGKSWKTSLRVAEQCWVLHDASTWPPCRGGLDWPAVHLSSSVDHESRQALVTVGAFQVAELRGSPHQITLSRSSRLMPWCGRRLKESPFPRKFACYQRTKVRWSQCEDTDCNTCSFRTWLWAADFQTGHA
jgi:hypothetical protein